MNSMKINNLINKILVVFLIIQPIFDIKPFYNSISTLIRVIIIFALFTYYFFTSKNNKKYWLLIYPILIGIYFIFHHLNALNFHSLVPGNFNYTMLEEALYFVKMLSPFLLIYCLYKSDFTADKVIDIMKYLVLIIGLIIVVSNLFEFSYGSYSDAPIMANFFEWFNPDTPYSYRGLASKGLFEFANQIGAILIMFLPFITYSSLQKRTTSHWFILGLNVFSLILLCTKVSVLGILVVFFYTMFTFGFISFIHKRNFKFKQYIPIGIVLVIYCILLPVNPMFSRIERRATIAESSTSQIVNEISQNTINDVEINKNDISINIVEEEQILETQVSEKIQDVDSETNKMLEYIEDNYKDKKIQNPFLFEYYPYKYDPEFWYNFLHNPVLLTTDYRYLEISLIKRVVEINDNPMDKLLGITNIRLQNIFNIEQDFIVQYYALGWLGTILIFLPYAALLISFAYQTIRKKFKNLNTINLLAAITIVFLFGIAYFSGNLLNSLSFTIYFTLCFHLLNIQSINHETQK